MGLESSFATLNDLNTSWPLGTDDRSKGDDHLRGLKTAVKSLLTNPQQIGLPTFAGNAGKLAKVNAGATALDVIAQGAAGGLDADMLDGNHAAAFALASHAHAGADITSGTINAARLPATADMNGRVAVKKAGTLQGTRRGINFIEGTNITLNVADDSGNEEVDVTITAASGGGGDGGLVSVQVFNGNGTWTRPGGITLVRVVCIGGGGAGASGSTNNNSGGGGGAGARSEKIVDVTAISSVSVTVGAGGGSAGLPGAASSFGAHCTANGGQPGNVATGGLGGTSGTGDWSERGAGGGSGAHNAAFSTGGTGAGPGGGPGGGGSNGGTAAEANSGGGGGGGGCTSGASGTGAAGGSGRVIVYEYV